MHPLHYLSPDKVGYLEDGPSTGGKSEREVGGEREREREREGERERKREKGRRRKHKSVNAQHKHTIKRITER